MQFSPDNLVKPISEEQPCGEDLEYDSVFQLMENSLQSKSEQEFGDTIIPGSGPDWKGVEEHAGALLERTRDIRALTFGAIAVLHNKGFPAFWNALKALNGCLEEFWADIYPLLDEEDNNDATMRYNALAVLNDRQMVTEGMFRAPLVELKGVGRFSLRDIELAEGKISPSEGEEVHDIALVKGAFGDAGAEDMAALGEAMAGSRDELQRIVSLFGELAPEAGLLDFDRTIETFKDLNQAIKTYAPAAAVISDEADDGEGGTVEKVVVESGAINNRNDVIKAIDKICDYYSNNEPSSPVPLLLRRAQSLVSKSFEEIVADMLPEGVQKTQIFSGKS